MVVVLLFLYSSLWIKGLSCKSKYCTCDYGNSLVLTYNANATQSFSESLKTSENIVKTQLGIVWCRFWAVDGWRRVILR